MSPSVTVGVSAESSIPIVPRTAMSIAYRSHSMVTRRCGSTPSTSGSTAPTALPSSIYRKMNSMTVQITDPDESRGEFPTRLLGSYLTGAATVAMFAFVAGAWAENSGLFADNTAPHREQVVQAISADDQT